MFGRIRVVVLVCASVLPHPALAMSAVSRESSVPDPVAVPEPLTIVVIAGGAVVVGGIVYRLRRRGRKK